MNSEIIHTHIRTDADGARIIAVTGEIDLVTAGEFQRALDLAAEDRARLTVDLAACDFLDSAGIKVLFEIAARLDLSLIVDPASVIATMIDISGLANASSVNSGSRERHPDDGPRG